MTASNDFWSRRKARVAAEDQTEAETRVALTEAEDHARLEACSDEDVLAELNLPDPDSLKQGDDFSVFMAKAVPERLRRRALRKLWVSNPVLACVDGLNDYDEDYNIVAVSGAAMKTAYQVGRGIVRDIVEETPKTDVPTPGAPDDAVALAEPHDPTAEVPAEQALASYETPTENLQDSYTPSEPSMPPRRRMQFAFSGGATPSTQDIPA